MKSKKHKELHPTSGHLRSCRCEFCIKKAEEQTKTVSIKLKPTPNRGYI